MRNSITMFEQQRRGFVEGRAICLQKLKLFVVPIAARTGLVDWRVWPYLFTNTKVDVEDGNEAADEGGNEAEHEGGMAAEGDSASDSNVYSSYNEEYGSERDNDEFMDGQRRKRISKKSQSVAPLQVRHVGSDYGDSSDEVITSNSTDDEGESSKMVKRSKTFNPKNLWEMPQGDPIFPPMVKKQPGRPKKNRKKHIGEQEPEGDQVSRKGQEMRCSICHEYGHNRRTCKKKNNQPTDGRSCEARQVDESQQVEMQSHVNEIRRKEREESSSRKKKSTTKVDPRVDALIRRELSLAFKGVGVLTRESGMTYIRMPGEEMRMSYKGRHGGQFVSPIQTQSSQVQQQQQQQQQQGARHQEQQQWQPRTRNQHKGTQRKMSTVASVAPLMLHVGAVDFQTCHEASCMEEEAKGNGRFGQGYGYPSASRGPHGLEGKFRTKFGSRLIVCSRFVAQTNVELSMCARKRFK
ncbi:hypothetical protein CRG98_018755 [Punica granatum]|uniref:Uncharacterized protein n=1 Tax=Punica granatum TaxID=22663 RepID=A0A2I0JX07_PUNGR|nr:hypothetical protein CRG98_018755 [Punica granatum]